MLKTKSLIYSACFATLATCLFAVNASAANKDYIVRVNNNVTGDDASSLQMTYELQNIDGTVVSSKTSSDREIAFDPITLDDADTTSYFYKIVQKDASNQGASHDSKVVYVRIKPSDDILAYQDDTTYKTLNDGSGPHPYHATDAELQGQAYAVYDSETKTLTFFRDEENKYTDQQVDGTKTYFAGFELANRDHYDSYGAVEPSWGYSVSSRVADNATKVVFQDAIRPEGAMLDWFSNFVNLEEVVNFNKLDTSRATSMNRFFYNVKKVEVDIRTLDFSRMAEIVNTTTIQAWNGFMERANITEFDSRNFAKIEAADNNRPIAAMFLVNNLRYLNTTNIYSHGSSAEFGSNTCLERLVVGTGFSFYRSMIDNTPSSHKEWLKIETGQIDTATRMIRYDGDTYNGDPNPKAAGNYVRPTCNTTTPTFSSVYKKPKEDKKKDDIKNPETGDGYLMAANLAVVSMAGLFVAAILGKAKHE